MSKADVWFDTRAAQLPSQHGYTLFSALCRIQPLLHTADVGVHTVHGDRVSPRRIAPVRGARVGLRLPAESLPLALPLAHQELLVDGCQVQLGNFEVVPLRPASSLSTWMATIKNATDEQTFVELVKHQLSHLGITATVEVGPRKVQRIAGASVVGFALRLHHLSEAHSLALQEQGIGGRRRMGCGLFRPSSVSPPEQA